MKKLFITLLISTTLYADEVDDILRTLYNQEKTIKEEKKEDLFSIAKAKVEKDKLEELFNNVLNFYADGMYNLAIEKSKEYLSKSAKNDYKRDYIYIILAKSYYKMSDTENMFNLVKNLDNISIDAQYKVIQIASLLFTEYKEEEKNNYLLSLIKKNKNYKLYSTKFSYINYKGVDFPLNRNAFEIKPNQKIIGNIYLYVVEKDQTLFELSRELDLGYYEMKYANMDIDPFDLRKGQIVIVPFRKILPVDSYKYETIYINLVEKRLYFPVLVNNQSYIITFPIGIGTDEAQSPIGTFKISEKRKDPVWYVPESIKKEKPELPDVFPPGEDNPLGTRAMRLGNTTFLMHGTNKDFGIGMRVSHGCIRMYNPDVEKLFEVVNIGTEVNSFEKSIKEATENGKKYIEIDEEITSFPSYLPVLYQKLFKINILDKGYAVEIK
ncbi:hypothetical protein JCM14244_08750 [Venenivibrio stagnispumantis]|uniref:Lipoprotein-anchoring transpeptidase ErfK/SrfK n=1 Tax=Venenivibrio stagnispumantis TaxID=407998 RepID=A0AA45WLW4_9AQUI|nr:L,D-transpeptidase family protein [Venenivibrio stagnispumantis]MCW4573425.1 L,D-transpeptidase family protein [Venenivibrio stagnispumantis]SMP12043.1 Lipoprotein-anchoring transpeptidase ErfK/SrfK [Venenivibrio stagnispumantis]